MEAWCGQSTPPKSIFCNQNDCLCLKINQQNRRWTRYSGLVAQATVARRQDQEGGESKRNCKVKSNHLISLFLFQLCHDIRLGYSRATHFSNSSLNHLKIWRILNFGPYCLEIIPKTVLSLLLNTELFSRAPYWHPWPSQVLSPTPELPVQDLFVADAASPTDDQLLIQPRRQ